jgi:hypothetical protein
MANEKTSEYGSNVVSLTIYRFGNAKPPGPPLQPPSGGDGGGMMEARVAHLEADVGHIKGDVGEVKESLKGLLESFSSAQINFTRLDTNVSHLPSKGFILTALSGGVVLIVGILTVLARFGFLAAHH